MNGSARKEGRRVYLVPAAAEHAPWFARWRSDIDQLHLWTGARRILPPNELATDLDRMLAGNVTLVAVSKQTEEPMGFIQAYNFAADRGHTFMLAYFEPRHRRPGVALESMFIFIDYLFKSFPLRKIYGDVFEYNDYVLAMLDKSGWKEEGRFEQHLWYDDRYWAMLRMSLFREDWYVQRDRLMRIMTVEHDIDYQQRAAGSAASEVPSELLQ